jgi:hypothetical protein
MSSYYSQQNPAYPPQGNPEEEIYDENDYDLEENEDDKTGGDSLLKRGLIFFAGGCLVFVCIACCGLLGLGVYSLDVSSLIAGTPIPGSDIGLSFEQSAYPDEAVVNENQIRLKLLEATRNASLDTVPPVEGRELIIVTVELTNLGNKEVDFNERNFLLLNSSQAAYQPTTGADVIDGALGRGTLPAGEGLEGRLVFEVIAGDQGLVLNWEDGSEAKPRFISLQ